MAKDIQQATKQYRRLTAKNVRRYENLLEAAYKSKGGWVTPSSKNIDSRQKLLDGAYVKKVAASAGKGDRYAKAWATRVAKYGPNGLSAKGLTRLIHGSDSGSSR